eukprot:TRINITY_DN2905_c0_g1_i2.p1 TRINITY_DN2905_c0_g1~~TRINITY_DN2905_c0_g1_i2.p1  ORF type:complete len:258 (+),score=-15.91 TRINITY_DN2905_c0_g1_i2:180-953(+)
MAPLCPSRIRLLLVLSLTLVLLPLLISSRHLPSQSDYSLTAADNTTATGTTTKTSHKHHHRNGSAAGQPATNNRTGSGASKSKGSGAPQPKRNATATAGAGRGKHANRTETVPAAGGKGSRQSRDGTVPANGGKHNKTGTATKPGVVAPGKPPAGTISPKPGGSTGNVAGPQGSKPGKPRKATSEGGADCTSKFEWPELVGMNVYKAKQRILTTMAGCNLDVKVVKQGTPVTMDFRTNRVRLFYDDDMTVASVPKVG